MTRKNRKTLEENEIIGKLTVVGLDHVDKRGRKHYLFKCSCGNTKVIQGSLVVSGNTKSCGCLVKTLGEKKRLPDNGGQVTQIILQYKRHARDRGIGFFLTREEVINIISEPCRYCGVVGGNTFRSKNCVDGFRYNGIDRADTLREYTLDNCVPCCGVCNKAKGVLSESDFISLARKIVANQDAMASQWSNYG